VNRLDLERRRGTGEIIGDALQLFFAHAGVFFTATLIVVAPITILVDGVLGHEFTDGIDASPPAGVQLLSVLLGATVIPTIVTSLHVRAVQGLAEGIVPTVGGVLRQALELAPRVLPVVLLYALGVAAGFVALIIPGIYLGTRWYFNAQTAVVDGQRGTAALGASSKLVEGSWWRVFGTVLLLGITAGIIGYVIGALLGLVVRLFTDSGAFYVIVQTFGQTIALSISALGGTLLFFTLRREKGLTEEPLRGFLPPTPDAFGNPGP
jgi:hypothetical protein